MNTFEKKRKATETMLNFRARLAMRYSGKKYWKMLKALDFMVEQYGLGFVAEDIARNPDEAELALRHYWDRHHEEIKAQPEQPEQRFHHVPAKEKKKIARRYVALMIAGIITLVLLTTLLTTAQLNRSDAVIQRADKILEAGK